jgi:hypothetical protein
LALLYKKILFLLLLLVSASCFSQNTAATDIRDVTKLNFFDPGFSYEKRIGKLQSLTAQAFLSTSIYLGFSSSLGNTSRVDVYPALSLQYRYYYNAAKRNARGKRTEMNSLNYLSAITEVDFYKEYISLDEKGIRALKIVGFAWGFQRNYQKRFSLDLNLGLGYFVHKRTISISSSGEYITENEGGFTNIGHIGLGFWLNKRN